MIEEGLCKNKVQFYVGKDYDRVTLISHPRYFEFVISRSEHFQTPTASLCSHVRDVIKTTLATVTSCMNYHFNMKYNFGFECPAHPGRKHLCILAEETATKMECLQNPKKCNQFLWSLVSRCGLQKVLSTLLSPAQVCGASGPISNHYFVNTFLQTLAQPNLQTSPNHVAKPSLPLSVSIFFDIDHKYFNLSSLVPVPAPSPHGLPDPTPHHPEEALSISKYSIC